MDHQVEYAVRMLWGGAGQAEIPSSFVDLSDLRQVPDHQECWLDDRGRLLVFEILEHQASVENSAAAQFFFRDLAQSNGASEASALSFSPFPALLSTFEKALAPAITAHVCPGVGYQLVQMGRDFDLRGIPREGQEEKRIKVELAAIRILIHQTDLLITLSTPVLRSDGDPEADVTTSGIIPSDVFRRVLDSFTITDWDLFQSP
jgi:hypothetical protein